MSVPPRPGPLGGPVAALVAVTLAATAVVAHATAAPADRPVPAAVPGGEPHPESAGGPCGPGATPLSGPWRHPVDAPVVDFFRPPSGPYGPGNRGLEYGTSRGDAVVAVAAGEVTFAGRVGRSRFVVLTHGAGLRSTAAFLLRIDVEVGHLVPAGAPIGTADEGFHLTARRGDAYVDPLPLIGGGCFVVRLVPVPGSAR